MKNETAVFGGGCFWCTEAVFKMLKGVSVVDPGYAVGEGVAAIDNPTYDQVSNGNTGYAEVVYIEYDSTQVKYTDLLTVLFASHDPTTLNRQGNDVGTQYRSVIFYTTEKQKADAENFIKDLNASSEFGKPIVTALEPLGKYFKAEDYHKDYFATHPDNPYCEIIINPKLEKVQKKFGELLKNNN